LAAAAERLFDDATDLSRKASGPSTSQVTMLEGYYASREMDGAFVFDRCSTPERHDRRWQGRHGDAACVQYEARGARAPTACCVYPDALIPAATEGVRGTWRV